jgi:hypothetical protein
VLIRRLCAWTAQLLLRELVWPWCGVQDLRRDSPRHLLVAVSRLGRHRPGKRTVLERIAATAALRPCEAEPSALRETRDGVAPRQIKGSPAEKTSVNGI